jgi:hypothetical protein
MEKDSLAEICSLFGQFYLSLFATISCDDLSWLLDELSFWRLFLAFMVDFSWFKGVYLVNAWTG